MAKTMKLAAGIATDGPIVTTELKWANHKASWLRYGQDGFGHMHLLGHTQANWLTVSASETSGAGFQKEVILTLDRAQCIVLRDLLNRVLGE